MGGWQGACAIDDDGGTRLVLGIVTLYFLSLTRSLKYVQGARGSSTLVSPDDPGDGWAQLTDQIA